MNVKPLSLVEKFQALLIAVLLGASATVTYMAATSLSAQADSTYVPVYGQPGESGGDYSGSGATGGGYIPPASTGGREVTIRVPSPSRSYEAEPGYVFTRRAGTLPSEVFEGCWVLTKDVPWFLSALKKEFVDHTIPAVRADKFCVPPPSSIPAVQAIGTGYGTNLKVE